LILTLLWLFALANGQLIRALTLVGLIVVFSFGTEWYQELLPFDRTAELLDAVADTAGALLGFAVWSLRMAFTTDVNAGDTD